MLQHLVQVAVEDLELRVDDAEPLREGGHPLYVFH